MRDLRTVLFLLLASSPLAAQERLAIKGGRILPVAGPPIEGGIILINKGMIEAVGMNVPIPVEAKVIDATGKVVVPGFIEVHSLRGMDQPNETNPNVPFLSVLDAIDPVQEYFEECRRQGITTVAVMPGNNTMFGGQGAVLKSAGMYINDMIVKRSVGLKISLKPASGRNRMGHMAAMRKELDSARDALAAKAKSTADAESAPGQKSDGENGPPGPAGQLDTDTQRRRPAQPAQRGGGTNEPVNAALVREALSKVLTGDLIAFIHCELAMDVPQAIQLVKDYKLNAVLVLEQDCHKAVKHIAAAKLPVILDPTLVLWETDPRTGAEKQIILPKLFREAGVPMMFQVAAGGGRVGGPRGATSGPSTIGSNYLWYQAATAVKYGTPAAEALQAITLRPAQALGIDKAAGTIEPGKDADLAILTGDPLKLDTWVDTTIVRGEVVYERANDRKLKALLNPDE